jgi:N-acetylmuramoyl-L-alanine amidase
MEMRVNKVPETSKRSKVMKKLPFFSIILLLFVWTNPPLFVSAQSMDKGVLKGRIICIDPGHGGTANTDSYRVGPTGEREEWVNLRVGLLLKEMLEDKGATVVMTRAEDKQVPLADRSALAIEAKAELFVSIHHNATADDQVNFPIIYFHGSANENLAGLIFGTMLAEAFLEQMYGGENHVSLVSDHTVFPQGGASVLRGTYGIPGVLAEASFFTHPKEEDKLREESYNKKEALAYVQAMERFFAKPPPPILEKKEPGLINPFAVLQEAERMQPEARLWREDFEKAQELMVCSDRESLVKAYDLFTRSARSFPDSYLARACHQYRAEILEKIGKREEAAMERKRVAAFFVEVGEGLK